MYHIVSTIMCRFYFYCFSFRFVQFTRLFFLVIRVYIIVLRRKDWGQGKNEEEKTIFRLILFVLCIIYSRIRLRKSTVYIILRSFCDMMFVHKWEYIFFFYYFVASFVEYVRGERNFIHFPIRRHDADVYVYNLLLFGRSALVTK